jgi:hypothetical protein
MLKAATTFRQLTFRVTSNRFPSFMLSANIQAFISSIHLEWTGGSEHSEQRDIQISSRGGEGRETFRAANIQSI